MLKKELAYPLRFRDLRLEFLVRASMRICRLVSRSPCLARLKCLRVLFTKSILAQW